MIKIILFLLTCVTCYLIADILISKNLDDKVSKYLKDKNEKYYKDLLKHYEKK